MKLTFYFDYYGGAPTGGGSLFACTHPNRKLEGAKRFAFDVVIPDNELHDVDVVAPDVKVRQITDVGLTAEQKDAWNHHPSKV